MLQIQMQSRAFVYIVEISITWVLAIKENLFFNGIDQSYKVWFWHGKKNSN